MEQLITEVISSVDNPKGVAAIAILIYGLAWGFKQNPKFNNKALPVLAIIAGAVVGIGLGIFSGVGAIDGLFTGAFSGMIATGGQELYKSIAWLIPMLGNKDTSSTTVVEPEDTTTTTTINSVVAMGEQPAVEPQEINNNNDNNEPALGTVPAQEDK